MWTESTRVAFKELKHSLMSAEALGLPDLTKLFEVFTWETKYGFGGISAVPWKQTEGCGLLFQTARQC